MVCGLLKCVAVNLKSRWKLINLFKFGFSTAKDNQENGKKQKVFCIFMYFPVEMKSGLVSYKGNNKQVKVKP